MGGGKTSANFGFLAAHDPLLDQLGGQAERYFAGGDPNTALIKLRQWGEHLAELVAAHLGVTTRDADFRTVLVALERAGALRGADVARVFHDLRRSGNAAVHEHSGDNAEALHQLKMARKLAVWFHRDVAGSQFEAGPFVPPAVPTASVPVDVADELARLKAELAATKDAAAEARRIATEEARLRAEAEARAKARGEETDAALALAAEVDARLAQQESRFQATLTDVAAATAAKPPEVVRKVVDRAGSGGDDLELTEAETRRIIDGQLRAAGWEVDSRKLRHAKGARPQKGKNLAISEWPTTKGPADYVLFCGLVPVAVVEAKKKNKDVSASIEQARRYSRGFEWSEEVEKPGGPWGQFRIPFLYSTNGRPYLRQFIEKSGIWHVDARLSTNHPHALEGWHRPDELLAMLQQDREQAAAALRAESPDYLQLRDYQTAAIRAAEEAILAGKRELLLAMATGCGKTRLAIGLLYRLVKARMFRRILFLVDRRALGEQALNAFKDVKLENNQTFTDIYDVKELADLKPDPDTRLQIATIQGMVRRVLEPGDGEEAPSVGAYDCVLIDEAHRGYNLDQDMTDAELEFRDQADYVSTYRRVLDHFDAVKIGLTATPAQHTLQIFGPPVYEYSYRRAVIDGYLVDYEPPIRIVTKLAEDGITWKAKERIEFVDSKTDQLQLFETPDEVAIDIEGFNLRVHTRPFNEAVLGELVKHVDPSLPGKTLIFAASDLHADTVVTVLKERLREQYGPTDDDVVAKITGATDKPLEAIRRFKNERQPTFAVTVELLTTGIDVPEITNLVFLRRVRSRILYEQMLGRATRKCDAIGKERFRIFDAVELYDALEPFTAMKPVVTNPSVTFAQLAGELSSVPDASARQEFFEQLVAKLRRKKRAFEGKAGQTFETKVGEDFETVLERLARGTPEAAAAWFKDHPTIADFLDESTGDGRRVLISTHADEVRRVERGYGKGQKPDDYLEGFRRWLRDNADKVPALTVVAQRPRDLTRKELKELELLVDEAGYPESALRSAVKDTTNADIAASIVGFIRRELLASPLLSFEERVDRAVKRILSRRAWTDPQRRWLEKIAKQIKVERVVDRDALDRGIFKKEGGGFDRLNKTFEGGLADLVKDLHGSIWDDTTAA